MSWPRRFATRLPVPGQVVRPRPGPVCQGLAQDPERKIVRRAIRARLLDQDPGDLSSLENPSALDEIARVGGRHGSEAGGSSGP